MPYEGAKDGKHYWLTPPDIYQELDDEFRFDFDPCPYPRPDEFDGLEVEWGQSNYVNPPFKGPTAWVRKAIEEYKKGKKVVFVFPIDKWIHLFIEAGAEIRNLKDIKWCAIEDGQPGKGTGRHIAAFVLDPSQQTPNGQSDPHIARLSARKENMYLRITDDGTKVAPGVYLISKLHMASLVDFLAENVGLQIADAEQCVQTELGRDTIKEVNPGDWIRHGKRLFWVCECEGIAHLVGEYSKVCELCGASRPDKPADSSPAQVR